MLVVGFLNKGVVLARLRAYIQKACSPIPHSKMKMPAIRINIIAEAMPSGTLTCKAIPAMMSIPPHQWRKQDYLSMILVGVFN